MRKTFNALDISKRVISERVSEGDICIDATAGRGNDTAYLCELAGKSGKVTAFDIQQDAVDSTKMLLEENGMSCRADVLLKSHSEMDSYQIKQGQKYKNLKRSVVIFVCGFDMFQENRSIYTFETVCRQNPSIVLNDKRITYFVNIHGDRNDMDQNTVNLLDYFKTGEPTDPYTRRLQQQVERIRSDDEWRENYMTFEMKLDQRFEDGKQLGRAEGEKNRDRNLILKWVQKGKTVSEMAEDLEKPEDYVRELMK